MEIAIMVEGQNGLTWPRWKKLANAVEDLGFAGLYRSDHYTNANPPDVDSLECWVSLTWLASHTTRIEFGPLVSPFSFRHPTMTARMASAVDDLSGGRLHLGVGAGWQEREHDHFGWDLLSIPDRFDRFEEGLQVLNALLAQASPVNFDGKYYQLKEAVMLPRPLRPGGPPILIGGNGAKRTLPLAASYAKEWNAVYLPPEKVRELNLQLDKLLEQDGKQPETVKRSLMTGFFFGYSDHEVQERAASRKRTVDEFRAMGVIYGTANQVIDQLGAFSETGIYRIMLQWLDLDDLDRLEKFAAAVLPKFTK